MLAGEKLLCELVTAPIDVARGAGEVIRDPNFGGATEIVCDRQNFIRRFAIVDLVLSERAGRADCKQLGCGPDKPGKEQLLPIELRTEARHGMKQPTGESSARPRRVTDVALEIRVEIVDLARAIWQPLTRIPAGVKFPGSE